MRVFMIIAAAWFGLPGMAHSQSDIRWTRRAHPATPHRQPFASTQAVNLPTAETINRGEIQFEISHRFLPEISSGYETLYGFDGPVNMRLGLSYAPLDRLMVTLARSNERDNVDVQVKYRLPHWQNDVLPLATAVRVGAAWSEKIVEREDGDERRFQWYGQVVINAALGDRLAVGVVPSYLYNSVLEAEETETLVALGIYGNFRLTHLMSLVGEWNMTERGYYYPYDAVALGLELNTGGHFFKVIVTNSTALNSSLFLAGARTTFDPSEWRIGFNITRLFG